MFLASTMNSLGLFQALGGWPKGQQAVPGDGRPTALTEAFTRATAAIISLHTLRSLEIQVLDEYRALAHEIEDPAPTIRVHSVPLCQMVSQFGPFFSSLRSLQDLVFPLVGSALSVGTPQSMNVKPKKRRNVRLPVSIKDAIWEYWDSEGAKVKAYRDIDHHYTAIMARSFIQVAEPQRLVLLLPDNPEGKSPRLFTYEEQIDALDYCEGAIRGLDGLLSRLGQELGITPAPIKQSFDFMPPLVTQVGIRQALALLVEDASQGKALIIGQTPDRRLSIKKTW
jgi:hypothetical protein